MKLWPRLKKKIRNTRFSRKLFAAFFLTSSITLIPLGIYSYYQAHNNLLDKEKQSVKEQIWQANTMLNSQIAQSQTVISSLLYNSEIMQCLNTENISYYQQYLMFENSMEPTIEGIVSSHSNILLVKIYTDNETLKGHSRYLYDLEGLPEYDKSSGRMLLRYKVSDGKLTAVCQYPPQGTGVTNVLYIEFRISESLGLMLAGEKQLILADGSGHIIFESPGMQGYADYGHAETYQEVRLDGEKYILFVNDIPETGWNSLCFVPERKMEINDPSILKATLLVLILAVFLCLLMSWLLCRWLLGPLEGLRSHIRRVEEGDFSIRVEKRKNMPAEMAEIADGFNEMVKRTDLLLAQVRQAALEQKNAEISALEAQVDPHFLYNTLDTINWKAIEKEEYEISEMVGDLGDILRYAIKNAGGITTLGEEIAWLKKYVRLQQEKLGQEIQIFCSLEAPSISAASISALSTPDKVAK